MKLLGVIDPMGSSVSQVHDAVCTTSSFKSKCAFLFPLNAPLAIAQIFGNAVQMHESTLQNGHVSCPFPATAMQS